MVTSAPRPTSRVVIDWDVAWLPADVATVETLARFQLAARRRGYTIRLRNAPAELTDLIALLGLRGVLPSSAAVLPS
jgi:ABC-type transporter Mla MlaB component